MMTNVNTNTPINREGYWASDANTMLPHPVSTSWKGKVAFLRLLDRVENGIAERIFYKGFSVCRMCGQANGSEEFELNLNGNTWVWPSGYRHYIEEHQVRPSLAFEEFIAKAGVNKL